MTFSASAINLLCWDVFYRDARMRIFWHPQKCP